jgi:hypothetical protein
MYNQTQLETLIKDDLIFPNFQSPTLFYHLNEAEIDAGLGRDGRLMGKKILLISDWQRDDHMLEGPLPRLVGNAKPIVEPLKSGTSHGPHTHCLPGPKHSSTADSLGSLIANLA